VTRRLHQIVGGEQPSTRTQDRGGQPDRAERLRHGLCAFEPEAPREQRGARKMRAERIERGRDRPVVRAFLVLPLEGEDDGISARRFDLRANRPAAVILA
jgi:hypothetical protein